MGTGGLVLLVVDDTDDLRALVRISASLDDRVATVLEAVNGADGLAAAIRRPDVDVVVLDYEMPNGTGLDVLPDLRAALPTAMIAFYTSDDTVEHEAFSRGADLFHAKPTPFSEVLDQVAELALRREQEG